MIDEPWFDPGRYTWIPGAAIGSLGGILGALAGVLAPRGRAKRLVLGLMVAMFVGSLGLLAVGIVAKLDGQPYGIWYGFGLAGAIGTFCVAPLFPFVRARYREAEARRMAAKDL